MILGVGHFYRLARAGYITGARRRLCASSIRIFCRRPRRRSCVSPISSRAASATAPARALVRALAQIGPSYVKLGQFLATRPDVVGGEIADALTALQDRMEPFGRDKGRRDRRKGARQEDRRDVSVLRRAGRRGFRRAGAYRPGAIQGRRAQGCGESAAAGHRRPIRARSARYVSRRATRRALFVGSAAAAHDRGRRHARAHREA